MRQVEKYEVLQQGYREAGILDGNDAVLVNSYPLGIRSFNPDESRLDVVIYDQNGTVLDHQQDISEYTIRGVEQGPNKVNQLEVDPTIYYQDRTYLGDIVVEYQAFNNLYSKGAELFVFEISTDRTEVRAKSLAISISDLRYFTQVLQERLNNRSYFSEAYLEAFGEKYAIVNATTEVVDNALVATFKLYKPLPEAITLRTPFQVLESLGESNQFLVRKSTIVVEDPPVEIKGPNFNAKVPSSTYSTPYKNYLELLSQKSWDSSKELYTTFKRASQHVSVDYSDFSQFIHFSSAFERLENARYKFELIIDYKQARKEAEEDGKEEDVKKYNKLIEGLIDNFDHYENFLYFENHPAAWPKKRESYPDGPVIRPYEIEEDVTIYEPWYDDILAAAERYDENNKDILIATIPVAIREDVDNNEPYIMFIHMIGQHFDDLWIYARAISDRYKADNRPEFGISKELVKDAIETFGFDLYETNQNLNALFDLIQPDGTYLFSPSASSGVGREIAVQGVVTPESTSSLEIPSTIENYPSRIETYTKEVYKRIYHNIPTLVKTKGTSRGLRVLLNCFGIPDSILKIRVQGGTDPEHKPFFGPEEWVSLSETGSFYDLDKINSKIRITGSTAVPFEEYAYVNGTGSFYTSSVLSRYVATTASTVILTDDSHKVEVGFDLNEAVNHFFTTHVTESFTVDDVIGDPRNKEENYGDAWRNIRDQILNEVHSEGKTFRSPAALIRFVRYFDTTFFRMLQDFLPARASIDSAVIVKDNILHRNRWPGVDVGLVELSMSGSAGGSTITGSHGGSFEYAGERFNTGDEKQVYNPDKRIITKRVSSGSREFNGELDGTEFDVLTADGDLSQFNTHRKDVQPANRYSYGVWFLDLPDPPLCGAGLSQEDNFGYYTLKSINGPATVQLNGSSTSISNATKSFAGNYSSGQVTNTHWSSFGSASKIFVGTVATASNWNGAGALGTINPSSTFTFGSQDYTKNSVFAVYQNKSTNNYTLWVQITKPTGQEYHSYDVVLTWKYLPLGTDPKPNVPGTSYRRPWTGTDPMEIKVTCNSGTKVLSIPGSEVFGTDRGYYWQSAEVDHNKSIDVTKQYGIVTVAGKQTVFTTGSNLIDATWFDNYNDWWSYFRTHQWAVVTGSQN